MIFGEPMPLTLDGVKLFIVGKINEMSDVEVFASNGTAHLRFYLPRTSRVIRQFWKAVGVVDVLKLADGAYDYPSGFGNFRLEGLAIGVDTPDDEDSVGSTVVSNVTLQG